jgi:hypothetical protein
MPFMIRPCRCFPVLAKPPQRLVKGLVMMVVPYVSVFILTLCLMVMSGCTISQTINDRLSYAAEQNLVERFQKAPAINFVADDATKAYQYESTPSGMVGAATWKRFPIGWTFVAYLEQAATAAFHPPGISPTQVRVHLSSCEMRYTNSGLHTGVDWVDITLTIDAYFSNQVRHAQPVAIKIHRIIDAPVEKTALTNSGYSVIVEAMEGLVTDFLDEVVRLSTSSQAQ